MSSDDLATGERRRAADLRTTATEEQVAFFEDSSHVAPVGNVVAGLVALSLLWPHAPTTLLLSWLVAVLVLAALQAIAALHPSESATDLRPGDRLIDTNVLAGVVWGVLPWLDIGAFGSDEVYRWICLALSFAIGAGAMGGLSVLTGIAMRIQVPMYLLVAAAFFVTGEPEVGIGVLVFLALMTSDLRATGTHLRQIVAARIETADLAAEAESEARHDTLTGLLNRAGALERIERLRGREPFVTMFIDLDFFKDVNDHLGHEAGDHVLVETARRLSHSMRPDDIVARLGGDEFVVVFPKGDADVEQITSRLIAAIEQPIAFGDSDASISASIGVAVVRHDAWVASELLREADHALYEAKRAGRQQVAWFDERLAAELALRTVLEGDFRAAIATNGVDATAHSVVDLTTDTIVSVEVAPCWTTGTGEQLGAAEVRGLAEEMGLGDALTRSLVDRAAQARLRWRADPALRSAAATVRLPAPHLLRSDVTQEVIGIVAERALRPGDLQLLVTETAAIRDAPALHAAVAALRSAGISIVLGDFGGGRSKLGDLLQLPIDVVALHPNLAAAATADERYEALLGGVDLVARSLGLAIAASGVDTPEQLDTIRRIGLPFAQGAAVRSPLPLSALEADAARTPTPG